MKKLKKIFLPIFVFCSLFFISDKIYASSGSVGVNVSKSSMVVGSSVTATVTISSPATLGSWQFDVYYDTSKLQLNSSSFGGTHIVGYGDGAKKSVSYTFNFTAKASGNARIWVANSSAYDWDLNAMSLSNGSRNVNIMTQAQLQATYSKNNNLASLGVDGYTLTPNFDPNTLEYSLSLDNTVEKINIVGSVADSKSNVNGFGERQVTEGDNRLEVVVTAQNGNVKTYVINATVSELNPIKVNVGDEELTVVKKKSLLTSPSTYTETTININDYEVPAFTSEISGYILVGLKNKKGDIGLYIYNQSNGKYTKYTEYKFNQITFYMMDYDETLVPKNYKLYDMDIKGEKVKVYKVSKNSNYALLYGMNIETGDVNLYMYDKVEETIQRYNADEVNKIMEENELFKKIILGLGIGFVSAFIMLIIVSVRKGKKEKNTYDIFEEQ